MFQIPFKNIYKTAAMEAPMIGPIIGTQAYFQLLLPFPFMGNNFMCNARPEIAGRVNGITRGTA